MTGTSETEWAALKARIRQPVPAAERPAARKPAPKPTGYDASGFPGASLVLLAAAAWPLGVWHGTGGWIAEAAWVLVLAGIIAGKRRKS